MAPAHAPATQSLTAVLVLAFELDGGGNDGVDEGEFILIMVCYYRVTDFGRCIGL